MSSKRPPYMQHPTVSKSATTWAMIVRMSRFARTTDSASIMIVVAFLDVTDVNLKGRSGVGDDGVDASLLLI